MAARDFNPYYVQNEYEREQEQLAKQQRIEARQQEQRRKNHSILTRLGVCFGFLVLTYGAVVWRSIAVMEVSNEIVKLQQQEARLVGINSELSINVEQLKGPERIMSIASSQLGLNVARSNIYVRAQAKKVGNQALAVAKK